MAYFKVVAFILREWTEEATNCVAVGLCSVFRPIPEKNVLEWQSEALPFEQTLSVRQDVIIWILAFRVSTVWKCEVVPLHTMKVHRRRIYNTTILVLQILRHGRSTRFGCILGWFLCTLLYKSQVVKWISTLKWRCQWDLYISRYTERVEVWTYLVCPCASAYWGYTYGT